MNIADAMAVSLAAVLNGERDALRCEACHWSAGYEHYEALLLCLNPKTLTNQHAQPSEKLGFGRFWACETERHFGPACGPQALLWEPKR